MVPDVKTKSGNSDSKPPHHVVIRTDTKFHVINIVKLSTI